MKNQSDVTPGFRKDRLSYFAFHASRIENFPQRDRNKIRWAVNNPSPPVLKYLVLASVTTLLLLLLLCRRYLQASIKMYVSQLASGAFSQNLALDCNLKRVLETFQVILRLQLHFISTCFSKSCDQFVFHIFIKSKKLLVMFSIGKNEKILLC